MRQKLTELKEELDNSTIIGNFTILFSIIETTKQKISRDTENLINQLDQTDMYGTFHPMTAECIFFLSAHRPFFRTDHMLGQKTNNR